MAKSLQEACAQVSEKEALSSTVPGDNSLPIEETAPVTFILKASAKKARSSEKTKFFKKIIVFSCIYLFVCYIRLVCGDQRTTYWSWLSAHHVGPGIRLGHPACRRFYVTDTSVFPPSRGPVAKPQPSNKPCVVCVQMCTAARRGQKSSYIWNNSHRRCELPCGYWEPSCQT